MATRTWCELDSNTADRTETLFMSAGSVRAKRAAGEALARTKKDPRSREQHVLKTILMACLSEIVAGGARMKAGRPETVHRLRVAGRRLQAALRIFRVVDPNETDRIRRKLNWLIDELGPAREVDTFIDEVLKPVIADRDMPAFVRWAYRRSLAVRKEAYHQASLVVSSREYRCLVEDLRKLSNSKKASYLNDERTEILTTRFLSKMRRKLHLNEKVRNLKSAPLHKLRLNTKRMRYSVEIAMLMPSKKATCTGRSKLLSALSRLQSSLGAINDMTVHKKRLQDLSKAYGKGAGASAKQQPRILFPKSNKRRRILLRKASRAYHRALSITRH